MRYLRATILLPAVLLALSPRARAAEPDSPAALTFYAARISEERTWQHVLRDPLGGNYADAYLVAGSYSRVYPGSFGEFFDGALRAEWQANLAYNFGDQDHLELNFAPVGLRWQRFPWSEHLRTTAALGIGLSYAFDFPELENQLEGDTTQLLLFWTLELTAGPRDGPWSVVLRLHHRSTGFGLMGVDDGGMNAPGIGVRFEF
jgi:hypothetical protein